MDFFNAAQSVFIGDNNLLITNGTFVISGCAAHGYFRPYLNSMQVTTVGSLTNTKFDRIFITGGTFLKDDYETFHAYCNSTQAITLDPLAINPDPDPFINARPISGIISLEVFEFAQEILSTSDILCLNKDGICKACNDIDCHDSIQATILNSHGPLLNHYVNSSQSIFIHIDETQGGGVYVSKTEDSSEIKGIDSAEDIVRDDDYPIHRTYNIYNLQTVNVDSFNTHRVNVKNCGNNNSRVIHHGGTFDVRPSNHHSSSQLNLHSRHYPPESSIATNSLRDPPDSKHLEYLLDSVLSTMLSIQTSGTSSSPEVFTPRAHNTFKVIKVLHAAENPVSSPETVTVNDAPTRLIFLRRFARWLRIL